MPNVHFYKDGLVFFFKYEYYFLINCFAWVGIPINKLMVKYKVLLNSFMFYFISIFFRQGGVHQDGGFWILQANRFWEENLDLLWNP